MSLSSILRPEAKEENWTQLHAYSIDTNNLTVQSLDVEQLTLGIVPNEYSFPTSIGTPGQSLVVSSGVVNELAFRDTVAASIAWGAVIGSLPQPELWLKISGNTSSSPGVANDLNSKTYIPFECNIAYIVRSVQNVDPATVWNVYVNDVPVAYQLATSVTPISPRHVPAGASIAVSYASGPSPGGASIYLWLVRI